MFILMGVGHVGGYLQPLTKQCVYVVYCLLLAYWRFNSTTVVDLRELWMSENVLIFRSNLEVEG